MEKDVTFGRWVSGQSGNPSGRTVGAIGIIPSNKKIMNSLKSGSKDAIEKLRELLVHSEESVRVKAAIKIADEAYKIHMDCQKTGTKYRRGDIRYEFLASLHPALIEIQALITTSEDPNIQFKAASCYVDKMLNSLKVADAEKAIDKPAEVNVAKDQPDKAPILRLTLSE